MSRALSEGQSHTEQVRNAASQSWQATASTGTDLLSAAEHRRGSSSETGSGFNNSVSKMTEASRSLSTGLSSRFGLSDVDSQSIARASQMSGDANAGLSVLGQRWGIKGEAGVGGKLSSLASETTGANVSAEQAYSDLRDYLNREVNTTQARNAREDFMRQTSTSGDSEVRSLSEKLGVSISDSRSASVEASRAEEAYQRVSHDVREASSRGWSLNSNETQEFVVYANERLLEDSTLASAGWHPSMVMPRTREQEQVRDILLGEFMDRRVNAVREELGVQVPERLESTLSGPSITTGAGVRAWGERSAEGVRARGPDVSVRESSRDTALASEVSESIMGGSARITNGALGLGNDVDDANERGGVLRGYVDDRNDRSLLTTMPVVGPVVHGIGEAGEWIGDKLGIGGGQSHVTELPRGERATLPVSGQIRSGMGGRVDPISGHPGRHNGIDIAAAPGTAIRSPASGTVLRNDYQENGAGNYVVLGHSDGSQSKYFHMQHRSQLPVGSTVSGGDVLGHVGSTGHSTGPHLHYELWKDGVPVDPNRHQLSD